MSSGNPGLLKFVEPLSRFLCVKKVINRYAFKQNRRLVKFDFNNLFEKYGIKL